MKDNEEDIWNKLLLLAEQREAEKLVQERAASKDKVAACFTNNMTSEQIREAFIAARDDNVGRLISLTKESSYRMLTREERKEWAKNRGGFSTEEKNDKLRATFDDVKKAGKVGDAILEYYQNNGALPKNKGEL